MVDNTAKLVRMANQIAEFYAPYPRDEQVAGVRKHLRAFWSPVMKRDLLQHIAEGGDGLKEIVIHVSADERRSGSS
jgi:formate dehydrogenase subunit delta